MPPINLSLNPYQGPFSVAQASHLLRRTTFNHSLQSRNQAVTDGMDSTVALLLSDLTPPEPPLNYGQDDPVVPNGETWVNDPISQDTLLYRRLSLSAWTVERMNTAEFNIREKMVLFWHNHFAISGINDPQFLYVYNNTLRQNALGNFKELVKAITIDPTMLRFLNGNSNTANAPNENYARELLELFTIGKGPIAGPGDYTNYTEDDILEISRILTGWVDVGFGGRGGDLPGARFINSRHDSGTKQLSHRFDNAVISNMGENEYGHLIDIIFQQDEIARYICRKLYKYFVYYEISQEIEDNIIGHLAQIMVSNDYEVKPVLNTLLRSEHFFDSELMGCQIKNPFEFLLPIFSNLNIEEPNNLAPKYQFYISLFQAATLLDMTFYDIPQVAGWKAYYQEPVYNRYWINNVTLGIRADAVNLILVTGLNAGGNRVRPDLITFITTLPDPSEPNNLIGDIARLLFTQELSQDQINFYKEVLIGGLPDFEWTLEYNNYLADPNNTQLENAIQSKLTALFSRMMNAPDFHLQ